MKNNSWRNKITWLVGLLVLMSMNVHSDDHAGDENSAIEVIRTGIPHDSLYDLEMDGNWGMAVGNFGFALHTADGGETWDVLPPIQGCKWSNVERRLVGYQPKMETTSF